MQANQGKVAIEEVSSVLTPAPGVSLDQAIADAELLGYRVIKRDYESNQAVIVWFKREEVLDELELRSIEATPDNQLGIHVKKIPRLASTIRAQQTYIQQVLGLFKTEREKLLNTIAGLEANCTRT